MSPSPEYALQNGEERNFTVEKCVRGRRKQLQDQFNAACKDAISEYLEEKRRQLCPQRLLVHNETCELHIPGNLELRYKGSSFEDIVRRFITSKQINITPDLFLNGTKFAHPQMTEDFRAFHKERARLQLFQRTFLGAVPVPEGQ